MPDFLLTINVLVCSSVPASIAYGISGFASFLTIANDIQTYDLLLVLLQRLKTVCFSFWVTSLVVSFESDIRKLNHINLTKKTSWHHGFISHFLPPGPKGHWYLHQVLQSMKDGKQANPADRMSHNRSLDPQLKGIELDWSLDYTNWQLSCPMLSHHCWY